MDFTDGPLATIANLPRLHSGCVRPCGCWGKEAGQHLETPPLLAPPGHSPGQRLGQNAALVQQEAWKIRKMRSLQSSRVGCDTGEEWGAQRNKELL